MNKLKRFLDGAVVVPYSDAILEVIDTACRNYNSDEDLDKFDLLGDMAECFLTGTDDKCFHNFLNESVAKEGTLKVLPTVVVQRLAGYKSYIMVTEADNAKDGSIMATIFMNYILLVKKHINNIPCGDLIHEIYESHLSCYIRHEDKLKGQNVSRLIKLIAEAEDPVAILSEKGPDDNINKQLTILAKSTAFYQYNKVLSATDIASIEEPFARVFVALCRLIHETSFCYYDYPFYSKIMNILSEDEAKSRKSIKTITDNIRGYADEWGKDLYSKSSLLLHCVRGDKLNTMTTILGTQISVKEFVVYLYYELIIEEILNQIYNDGE